MKIVLVFALALLAIPAAALPTVHWQFAVLPEDDAPLTLLTLEITDDDGTRTVPLGLCIGGPQDMDLADGPAGAILHGGAWWAGQGQYWAVVTSRRTVSSVPGPGGPCCRIPPTRILRKPLANASIA